MNRSRLRIRKLPEHLIDNAVVFGDRWGVFMGGTHVATFETWQECVALVWSAQNPPSTPKPERRVRQYVALIDVLLIVVAVIVFVVGWIFFGPPSYLWAGVLLVVIIGSALHWYLRNYLETK